MQQPGFIDQLVDWRDFERFVADLFRTDPDLLVEHDVTEVGKSGANRQVDVRVTHRVSGMTYVTIIECKRWKEKIDRGRIDVLAAAIEDLNAAKGVLFTTSGFEEGAELYARSRGIELFVVRDLTDAEWGSPGRVVSFWWRFVSGQLMRIEPRDAQLASIVEQPPASVSLELTITKEAILDEALTLHSVIDGTPGPNLMSILLEARQRALQLLAEDRTMFREGLEEAERFFIMPIEIDFTAVPTRQLHRNYGALKFSGISFELVAHVSQRRFRHDRGESLDFALAVENYVTHQRRVATRSKGTDQLGVFTLPDSPSKPPSQDDIVSENTMLLVFMEPWVRVPRLAGDVYPTKKLAFSLPSWRVTVSDVPTAYRGRREP